MNQAGLNVCAYTTYYSQKEKKNLQSVGLQYFSGLLIDPVSLSHSFEKNKNRRK